MYGKDPSTLRSAFALAVVTLKKSVAEAAIAFHELVLKTVLEWNELPLPAPIAILFAKICAPRVSLLLGKLKARPSLYEMQLEQMTLPTLLF